MNYDLDALDALDQAATPGEWRASTTPHPEAVRLKVEAVTVSASDCRIYTMRRDYGCLPETFQRQKADAKLIAAMRNALPAMLEDLKKLREIRQAKENADTCRYCDDDFAHEVRAILDRKE